MIGHSLQKHKGIMVSVDRDYPSAKIYAKVANSEDKEKCLFLYGGMTFLMGIQLLAVEVNGMYPPINQLKQGGADGQVRGVHGQAERKRVVWRSKHRLRSQTGLQVKEDGLSLISPHKTASFLKQVGQNG